MNKYLKSLLLVLRFAVVVFVIHYSFEYLLNLSDGWAGTGHSLLGLYAFQTLLSVFVAMMILLAQYAMPKNLGFIFLGLIFLKAIAGYLFIREGLEMADDKFLATHFLVTYFLFLFMDVYMAYRAINQAEPNIGTKF
ncbi:MULTISPECIES: hypothetical protein [Sphingobacterium]|uniref:DoxX family protein n=1 Tax=Sphingobacterium populi TaxID=1812824 RepID=A0ABW5UES0_9SPHI|nr:hypothetical protein [Sphingobacterium sp. CFCC 11742]